MGCRVLCLTLFTLLSGCLGQQCILITPNVLRLESEETIVVDGQDKAFEAEVEIHDFPKRSWFLAKQKISINNGNQFLGTATVKIPPYELTKDPKEKKYVYVLVKSPVCNLEKIVLLSNQNKYAFIQTDKTTYTPGSNVLYRIFSMNYKMSPPVNTSLVIEFLTPEKVFVKREEAIIDESGIVSSSHRLSEVASFGVWTISAKFKDFSGQIYTTNFGVKEFVPPTYEITLIPEKKYFYVDDTEFSVKIEAKFIHGDPVNGKALVIFGINKDSAKTSLPNTMKWIMINEGEGMAQLLRKDLVSNFINDEDMLECTLYMSITLITGSGSDIVESELEGIHIVKSPYKVLFTRTSKYFKPTMPFDLMMAASHEFLTSFIQLYRDRPCLWRVKSKDYRDHKLKTKAYEELAALAQPHFPDVDCNIEFVKTKIKSIRTVFKKEWEKVRNTTRSGGGTDEVHKPKLWYYDLLTFTVDQNEPRPMLAPENVEAPTLDEAQGSRPSEETSQEDDEAVAGPSHTTPDMEGSPSPGEATQRDSSPTHTATRPAQKKYKKKTIIRMTCSRWLHLFSAIGWSLVQQSAP